MQGKTLEEELDDIASRFPQSDEDACSLEVLKTLKESPYEMTELVCDQSNRLYVRKFIDGNLIDPKPYLLLQGHDCPYLPELYSVTNVGNQWIVLMEHLEGISLRNHIHNEGVFAPFDALELFKPVFLGLDYLHEHFETPLIHRDIKPDNIVVTKRGAMLIDFGAARFMSPGSSSDTHLMGTPGYAAPEQYGFRQSDVKSDIYALGKTIRFALTGKDPQEQGSVGNIAIDEVLNVACAFEPSARYASVRSFYSDFNMAVNSAANVDGLPSQSEKQEKRTAPFQNGVCAINDGTSILRGTRSSCERSAVGNSRGPAPSMFHVKRLRHPRVDKLLPSQKKPSTEWRFLQGLAFLAFFGMIAYTINYAFFDASNPNTPLSSCGIGFFLFAFPFLLLADPFDFLRKHRFYDEKLGIRLLIVFAICFLLALTLYYIDSIFISG